MKIRTWYAYRLVIPLAVFSIGLVVPRTVPAQDYNVCRVTDDITAYLGMCTRCQGEDPCGWNCHGVTSHAHGGEGGVKTPEDLGLRWGERYGEQPVDEKGRITSLAACDIVIFGVEIPDPPPDPSEKVTGFLHSATAIGYEANVLNIGDDPLVCGDCPGSGCVTVADANSILEDSVYRGKCVVFPGSAFGDRPEGYASLNGEK